MVRMTGSVAGTAGDGVVRMTGGGVVRMTGAGSRMIASAAGIAGGRTGPDGGMLAGGRMTGAQPSDERNAIRTTQYASRFTWQY